MGQSAPTPSVEYVRKSAGGNRGRRPSQVSVPPPTPAPAFGTIGVFPAYTRGSTHWIFAAFASALRRSVAGASRRPASTAATLKPALASSHATRPPHAPAPTITASTESA